MQSRSSTRTPTAPGAGLFTWGRRVFLLVLAIGLYVWSWQATQIDLPRLVRDAPKARPILTALLQPDLVTRPTLSEAAKAPLVVPCGAAAPPAPPAETKGPRVRLSQTCAAPRDEVQVTGEGFHPNTEVRLRWLLSDGRRLRSGRTTTDEQGRFTATAEVRPLLAEVGGVSYLQAEATWESGALLPSESLKTTVASMVETLFLALMATTFASVIAVPLSFLGARNIMTGHVVGKVIYTATRMFFNIMRSIEPIILAVIFAVWVGFGPFAGVLALTVFTIASLGKLFSEAVESIDPGPLEAITATGANRLQVIVYGVVPQIIPPYIAFGIYHWDINVRVSTVIGFVGGGGIGFVLRRWINELDWNSAATAVWAIVIVVWALDYISAEVRERFV